MELNALAVTNAADILSLINLSSDSSIVSTNSSASLSQDFNALLSEMTGPAAVEQASVAEIPLNTRPTTEAQLVENQPAAGVVPKLTLLPQETAKAQLPENPATSTKTVPSDNSALPLFAVFHFAGSSSPSVAAVADKNATKVDEPPVAPLPVPQETHPELERAFADVKTFELTVQPEVAAVAVARGEQRNAVPQDSPSKLAIVTTDAVANVLQQQLPPRVVPVLKVVLAEQKPADRSKPNTGPTADLASPSAASHINDLVLPAERIDQPPAAHAIEIPNLPRLPVVRTVAMQVGEAGSEVTVRIQQRSSGEVTLQLNAGNEKLQQNLQSSIESLAQALKLENVSVSGIEVSRKSPADKVHRMKETH